VAMIVFCVTAFDPTGIAKLASAFKLVMFGLGCIAVVVMRESGIASYDPGYRSPFYPGLQIIGILAPAWLIFEMGLLPTLFTGALMVGGGMWFTYYAKDRVDREGAIFHVFERLGRQRDNRLDAELREIIKERGPREADPFDELFTRAQVIDIEGGAEFEELARSAGELLARELPVMAHDLWGGFMKGTRVGATPVAHGVALPHVRLQGIEEPHLVLVRVPDGVRFESGTDAHTQAAEDPVRAVFFLAGPEDDPGRHLRILAALARRVDRDAFMPEWLEAQGSAQLKEALFRNERLLVLTLEGQGPHQSLVGVELRSVDLPDGTLVAMVGRGGDMIIPRGDTVLQEGDRVTVLGGTDAIRELRKRFSVGAAATE